MKKFRLSLIALLSVLCFSCDKVDGNESNENDYSYTGYLLSSDSYSMSNVVFSIEFNDDNTIDLTQTGIAFNENMYNAGITITAVIPGIAYTDNGDGTYSTVCDTTSMAPYVGGVASSSYGTYSNFDLTFDKSDIYGTFDVLSGMTGNSVSYTFSLDYIAPTPKDLSFTGNFTGNVDEKYVDQDSIAFDINFNDNSTLDIVMYGVKFSAAMYVTMYQVTIPDVSYTTNEDGSYSTVSDSTAITSTFKMSEYATASEYSSPITYVDFTISSSSLAGDVLIGGIEYAYASYSEE